PSVCTERVDGSAKPGDERFGGHAARHLARAVAAHAVGKRDDAAPDIGRNAVLVVLADTADIGEERHFKEFVRHASTGPLEKLAQRLPVAGRAMKVYMPSPERCVKMPEFAP